MRNRWWPMRNRVFLVAAGSFCFVACLTFFSTPCSADDPDAEYVRLVVDFGDGVEKHFTQLDWRDKMTVFDAMQSARQHPRGISFVHRGKGATLLLTQIDDVKNQGSSGKNWIYRVNSKVGDRSIAIYPVKSGDTILWKFETYR